MLITVTKNIMVANIMEKILTQTGKLFINKRNPQIV